jgi:methylenetetrahydrofolate reductase (NADPH)
MAGPLARARHRRSDAVSIKAFCLDVVTDLCDRLGAGGALGLHFCRMDHSVAMLHICKRLDLPD